MPKLIGIDESKAKRTTHVVCGAIIEYFEVEVKEDYTSDYLGDRSYYKYIICPKCGQKARTQ